MGSGEAQPWRSLQGLRCGREGELDAHTRFLLQNPAFKSKHVTLFS